MSELVTTVGNASLPRARRAPRVPALDAAISKLVERALGRSTVDVGKTVEVVAIALERSGDTEGAATVRATLADGPKREMPWQVNGVASNKCVHWFAAADLSGELVLDATTGAELARMLVELRASHSFIAAGIDAPTRVLMHGPSGVGKTLAARWLAGELGLPLAVARLHEVVNSHLGETSKRVADVIAAAQSCPSVLFLDEVESVFGIRAGANCASSREMGRATSSFLQQLDNLSASQIVIAATNLLADIDPALRRRLPTELAFGLPDEEARSRMAGRWLSRCEHAPGVERAIAHATFGRSGADVRVLTMAAARLALLASEPVSPTHVEAAALRLWALPVSPTTTPTT